MLGDMMDPEMMRIAQEQMTRMRPEDLQRMQQQMMSNPDLLRMASEGMKNLRPEDLRMAAEQMKNIPGDQIAEMGSRMASASPEEIASMRAQSEAQRSYEYHGALSLKAQGNQLHGIGKYSEAAEKYLRAKSNLGGLITSEAKKLRLTCSLNLMSCYLKTKQYQEVITEGTEVLKGDSDNVKALYRRGQAYKQLKRLKLSVSDLARAAEVSPEDETIGDILRQVKEELDEEGSQEELDSSEACQEENTDEAGSLSSRMSENTLESSYGSSVTDNREQSSTSSDIGSSLQTRGGMGDSLSALSQNPEMIRSMHSMLSTVDPEQLAAMSGNGMTPDMAKIAADMVKNMSQGELEKMMSMASQFQLPDGGFPPVTSKSSGVPNSELASTSTTSNASISSSRNLSQQLTPQTSGHGMPSMADFSPEMQDQMRKQMNNPAMKEMMASMVKSMTPETMVSMSEQLGLKLSPEEAAQAQKAMSNLSPADLDRIMVWADRAQRVAEHAKRAKNFLLGKPGLILAVVILLVAILLQYFGYLG